MSLIASMKIIKGDNSSQEIFSLPDFPDISSVNWIGHYTIRENNSLVGTILQEADLIKSTDNTSFIFYLKPTDCNSLEVGKYKLSIELKNLTLSMPVRLEVVQCTLTVTASGVTN